MEAETNGQIVIRQAELEDWTDAITLAWKTFLKYEAKDYGPIGTKNFRDFLTDSRLHRMFVIGKYLVFGAWHGDQLLGMISLRDEIHISLLFVDPAFHGMGIGSSLMDYMERYILTEQHQDKVTVDAAPYAVGFYHRRGFTDLMQEQKMDGIRFVPMEKALSDTSIV